jgi:hypothetical protein
MCALEGEEQVPVSGRKSRWKPWLIVFLSGIVLGGSSCAGFLSVAMRNQVILAYVLAGGFIVGVAATLVGALVLVTQMILSVLRRVSGGPS